MKYLCIITSSKQKCCGNSGPNILYSVATIEGDSCSVSPCVECHLMLKQKWTSRAEYLTPEDLFQIHALLESDPKLKNTLFTLKGEK